MFGVLILVLLFLGSGIILAVKYTPIKHKQSVVHTPPKPKVKALQSEEAKAIWKKYLGLDEEFQRFPDLFDALMVLDEKSKVNDYIDPKGALRHSYSCRYHMYGDIKQYCYVCMPYKELRNAVNALINAQKKRHRAIERAKKDLTMAELDSKMNEFVGLAERMRIEANIYEEVTDEIYGG